MNLSRITYVFVTCAVSDLPKKKKKKKEQEEAKEKKDLELEFASLRQKCASAHSAHALQPSNLVKKLLCGCLSNTANYV